MNHQTRTGVPPIFVAGMGRCGTSLVMQILHAGGIKCLGGFPAFEPECVGFDRDTRSLISQTGVAMKILDPQLSSWPEKFDAKIIWLNRDMREQSKSQIKFLQASTNAVIDSKAWRDVWKSLKIDKFKCVDWWNRCSTEPLFLSFEEVLSDPETSIRQIENFIGVKLPNAESCVIRRSPKSRRDISLELALIRAEEVASMFGVSTYMAAKRILEMSGR